VVWLQTYRQTSQSVPPFGHAASESVEEFSFDGENANDYP
jgi:hypothetical protein